MNETQNGTCVQFGTQGTFLDLKFETKYANGRGHWYVANISKPTYRQIIFPKLQIVFSKKKGSLVLKIQKGGKSFFFSFVFLINNNKSYFLINKQTLFFINKLTLFFINKQPLFSHK